MAEALTITDDELKTIIANRLRAMVEGATRAGEPPSFVRTWLLNEVEGVRALVMQLREGATHTIGTTWPQPIFTKQENAAAVDELFTERGV